MIKNIFWDCPDGMRYLTPVFPTLRHPNNQNGYKTWGILINYRSGTAKPFMVSVIARGNENTLSGKEYSWEFEKFDQAKNNANWRFGQKERKYNQVLDVWPFENMYDGSTAADVTDSSKINNMKPSEVLNFLDKYAT